MKCEACRGSGEKWVGPRYWPCEACQGSGLQHCCEGLQACTEVEFPDNPAEADAFGRKR